MDWLLNLGRTFLNKERVIQICKGLFVTIALAIFASHNRIIAYILQSIYNLGFATLCLALMVVADKHNYKINILGYYVIVIVIISVYLFFTAIIGTELEVFSFLLGIFYFVLHIIIGIQLLKSEFSVFGKAFLYYLGGMILVSSIYLLYMYARPTSVIELPLMKMDAILFTILIYPFYRKLPKYY